MIGPHLLSLPADSKLDQFQKKFPRYDFILGEIARILYGHLGSQMQAIDIGANVGDSAALICKYQNIKVLCIEGCVHFFEFLERNAKVIGDHIETECAFIGTGLELVPQDVSPRFGTYSIPLDATRGFETKTLSELMTRYPQFQETHLIKIDTDGFDFKILMNSIGVISKMKPVIFFEYYLFASKEADGESLRCMETLLNHGYKYYLIYDNFGHFLFSLNGIEKFAELNLYLLSGRYHGIIIPYFDVCAFPDTPLGREVFHEMIDFEFSKKSDYITPVLDKEPFC